MNNQKGFAHILGIILLLGGLVAGVYLVTSGNPLKLFSKASEVTSNCPGAIPNASSAQDDVIQKCLNDLPEVKLAPGTYIIAKGLTMESNKSLTSANPNNKAILLADPGLTNYMIHSQETSNLSFSSIIVDGNRLNRNAAALNACKADHNKGDNLVLVNVSNLKVDNVTIRGALCGGGLLLEGSDFELSNNLVEDNGFENGTPQNREYGAFADGMTVGKCERGYIHDNKFINNTDVSLIIGGGKSCRALKNTITQTTKFAAAGMWIFNFDCPVCGMGDHTDSLYADNTISNQSSGSMGAGLIVGSHIGTALGQKGGVITGNTISGAGVNLLIDGVTGARIVNNNLSNPKGKPGGTSFGNGAVCPAPYNYTVAHATDSVLQPGWVNLSFDNFGCQFLKENIVSAVSNSQDLKLPYGFLDSADSQTCVVSGWACDDDNNDTPVDIHFYADGPAGNGGTMIGAAKADQERPDLAAAGVCGGKTKHGFNYQEPDSLKDGQPHTIYAYGINIGIGLDYFNSVLSGSPKTFTCKALPSSPVPQPATTPTPTPGSSPAMPFYRFSKGALHLYTLSPEEKSDVLGKGWNDEGLVGYIYSDQVEGTVPVYRSFNPQNGDHFYTVSAAEKDSAADTGWSYEGIAGYIYPNQVEGSTPAYRLASSQSIHFYTSNRQERDQAIATAGYHDEGILGYIKTAP